ncbi:MAG TPA: sigma 54-interacting transcriptional regulator [Polyangiaceae bacterium]|nr:sigma 54-interacting transcriptional regulator [Polyangiaceae bacterium]
MSRGAPGQTTTPSLTSSFGAEGPRALVLAWLFPRTDGPTLELPRGRTSDAVLGRDEDCAVVLPGTDVSRRHAVVRAEGALSLLVDLDSRNGTFVNGRRIDSVVLGENDVVRIGGWVGVVTALGGNLGSVAPGLYGGATLREALSPAQRAAHSDLPILLEGETGTGKEAVSRAIHAWSGRSGPFVAVNCAALPESLAEGELFGYRRGAFTGAEQASVGHFRAAQRGTLLLDEVCELPLSLQAKLLRVIEQREVQPLGESTPVKLDVRILSAAQEPLARAVEEGRFRADLYARLDGVSVRLPPLRARRAEIPYLFSRLLLEDSGARPPAVDVRVVERLCLYDFPFNVRELALLVKRLLVLHGAEPVLKLQHLPPRVRGEAKLDASKEPEAAAPLASEEVPELGKLLEALRATGGNVARAAQTLGISRQRAYRMMQGRPEVDLESLREGGQGT